MSDSYNIQNLSLHEKWTEKSAPCGWRCAMWSASLRFLCVIATSNCSRGWKCPCIMIMVMQHFFRLLSRMEEELSGTIISRRLQENYFSWSPDGCQAFAAPLIKSTALEVSDCRDSWNIYANSKKGGAEEYVLRQRCRMPRQCWCLHLPLVLCLS